MTIAVFNDPLTTHSTYESASERILRRRRLAGTPRASRSSDSSHLSRSSLRSRVEPSNSFGSLESSIISSKYDSQTSVGAAAVAAKPSNASDESSEPHWSVTKAEELHDKWVGKKVGPKGFKIGAGYLFGMGFTGLGLGLMQHSVAAGSTFFCLGLACLLFFLVFKVYATVGAKSDPETAIFSVAAMCLFTGGLATTSIMGFSASTACGAGAPAWLAFAVFMTVCLGIASAFVAYKSQAQNSNVAKAAVIGSLFCSALIGTGVMGATGVTNFWPLGVVLISAASIALVIFGFMVLLKKCV